MSGDMPVYIDSFDPLPNDHLAEMPARRKSTECAQDVWVAHIWCHPAEGDAHHSFSNSHRYRQLPYYMQAC